MSLLWWPWHVPGNKGKKPSSANGDFPTLPLDASVSLHGNHLVPVAWGFSSPAQLEVSVMMTPAPPSHPQHPSAKPNSSCSLALSLPLCPGLLLPLLATPFPAWVPDSPGSFLYPLITSRAYLVCYLRFELFFSNLKKKIMGHLSSLVKEAFDF